MLPTKTSTWNHLLHPSLTSAERGSQEEHQRDHVHAEALLSATHSSRFLSAGFCSPCSGSAKKNGTSLVNHWPGKDGKRSKRSKTPLRGQFGSTLSHPARLEGASWDQFGSFFPHCIFRLLVIFSLCCRSDLRLLSSFGLFGMQTPPAPHPRLPTLELVRPKGSGNQSGKTSTAVLYGFRVYICYYFVHGIYNIYFVMLCNRPTSQANIKLPPDSKEINIYS